MLSAILLSVIMLSVVMISVIYAQCHLCWVSFMLSVIYAECRDAYKIANNSTITKAKKAHIWNL